MSAQQHYQRLLAQQVIAAMQQRQMEAFYCPTKEQALALLPQACTVSCGGSATLAEIGLLQALREGPWQFWDPHAPLDAAGKRQVAQQALTTDYFFTGTNAIAATGQLVNADGIGNRVAALSFGPQQVVVIAGLNKVTSTLEAAVQRVKTVAAPLILLHFNSDYPSYEALSTAADKAYSQLLITTASLPPGRIKVILVGETLGF